MRDLESTRRKFSIGLGSVLGVALAGCTSGDDGEEPTDTEAPTDSPTEEPTDEPTEEPTDTPTPEPEEYTLSIMVQSGSGANPPLEEATVSVDGEEVGETDIDGVVETTVEAGEYSVLAEKLRFENAEDEVTVEEDAEVTITLNEVEPDGQATLGLGFENGDGGRVQIGMDVTAEHLGGYDRITRSYVGHHEEIEYLSEPNEWLPARMRVDPVLNPLTLEFAGEWEITVEPNEENDFETYQETIEYTQEDMEDEAEKTREVVLEGAMSESERWRQQSIVVDGEQHHINDNQGDDGEWAWSDAPDESDRITLQEWSDSDNQRWNFELVGDEGEKWHRIVNEDTGMVWTSTTDPEEEGLLAWDYVHTSEWEETDNQLWRIRPVRETDPNVEEGDELYKIESKKHANDERFEYGAAAGLDGLEAGSEASTWWYTYTDYQQLYLSPHSE